MKFDLPLLVEEFLRCDIELSIDNIKIIDALRIYHLMEKRNLSAAYKFYCNKILENAHNSYADTSATLEIIDKQVQKYNGQDVIDNKGNILGKITDSIDSIGSIISNNIVDISGRIIKNSENKEIFNFGKYKNQIVSDVFKSNPEYYHWIMKSNFPQHSKKEIYRNKIKRKLNNFNFSL